MSAVRQLCDDADDNAGAANGAVVCSNGPVRLLRIGGRLCVRDAHGQPLDHSRGSHIGLQCMAIVLGNRLDDGERRLTLATAASVENHHEAERVALQRDHARRCAAAWKELARLSRREIGNLETELCEAEHRAKDAEHRADQANRALAISAERADALESRIRDLDAANSALLVERQRMQADLLRVDAERLDMHDEATHLLTRARGAERLCVELDGQRLDRAVTIASLQYDLDSARGHAAADRIKASMRLADMQAQRDREATRATNAEAACRDATGALVKAEAAVEYARQCVRHGLAACSDEEIMAEHVRRFLASGGI
jgi:chromosome segregation ATPase